MIGFLRPVFFVGSAINIACTAYCVSQIAYATYNKVREMHGQKMRASEVREMFIQEFKKEKGREPDDSEIRVALRTFNAVEHPVHQWVEDTAASWSEALEKCVEGEWLEKLADTKKSVTDLGKEEDE